MHKLIEIFKKVQTIPYKVCKYDESQIDEKLKEGDCRHKSTLLFNLLKKEGFEVKKIKVIFNWKDLPLPKKIISLLKKSSSIWDHDAVAVKINSNWIKVDCTWDPALKNIGFPVTINWDGKSDTLGVTNGVLNYYDTDNYVKDNIKIKIVKEEAHQFAESLNKLFEDIRKRKNALSRS
ncbi:MAG: hypothetical protein AABX11_00915 [Nanoarchaeota archaeon]